MNLREREMNLVRFGQIEIYIAICLLHVYIKFFVHAFRLETLLKEYKFYILIYVKKTSNILSKNSVRLVLRSCTTNCTLKLDYNSSFKHPVLSSLLLLHRKSKIWFS